MPYAQVDDVKLYHEVHGSGFPLVLSHSGFSNLETFAKVTPLLAEKYKVVLWDRRGCGKSSPAPDGSQSAERWVKDLHGLLRHLGIKKAYVGGVSYGSFLTVEYMLAHPETTAAAIPISCNPFGWGHDRPNATPFPDRTNDLPKVKLPVLWVNGELDANMPPSMGQRAQKLTPGSELVVFKGIGHNPERDAPEQLVRAITDFLSRVEARSGVI